MKTSSRFLILLMVVFTLFFVGCSASGKSGKCGCDAKRGMMGY